MSYEGYKEYLCKNGHYWTEDVHDDSQACPNCGLFPVHRHSVDVTNEVEGEAEASWPARKAQTGTERKTIEVPIYRPGPEWREIPLEESEGRNGN